MVRPTSEQILGQQASQPAPRDGRGPSTRHDTSRPHCTTRSNTRRAPGTAVEVAPGVRWLRMPLPFALDHINLWLLRRRRRLDAGGLPASRWTRSRGHWEQIFDQRPGRRAGAAASIVTHFHPDHLGLADWLAQRFGAAGGR
ncbi:MAG: hypothetical protein MZW92_05065 [Comamonadaceae bacterium]|nr:hypothetical protein [Comamonadaceae bacterium]